MTSAVIYSRDFLAARRRAETEVLVLVLAGTKIAFAGGPSGAIDIIKAGVGASRCDCGKVPGDRHPPPEIYYTNGREC
jgi:hypothetical protein